VTDDELRELVRQAVARHLGVEAAAASRVPPAGHFSHARFVLPRDDEPENPSCLIEPKVRCTHCGFCLSYGH